ncbi:MAG: DUF2059 domain-containing protein [Gammaproteobacteria bacterium]|nr:DUF2059 domain-containing protein [Gammaproteobacteria bacterium]
MLYQPGSFSLARCGWWFICAVVLLFTLPVNTRAETDPALVSTGSESLVRELMQAAALDEQLKRVPAAIELGLFSGNQDQSMFDGLSPKTLRMQLRRAFNPEHLQSAVASSLTQDLNAEQMSRVLEFLNSDLGKRIVEQEQQRTLQATAAEKEAYLQSLNHLPPQERRVSKLHELDQAWNLSEANVDMMIDMQIAMSIAIMPAMPESFRMSPQELSALYGRQREALLVHYRRDTLQSMLFVYDALTLEEISDYIDFAKSAHGRKFVAAQNRALKKAMLEGSLLWGREISSALQHDTVTEL